MIDVNELTITKVQELYRCRKISIKELVEEYLHRISFYDQGDNKLNSILEINPDAVATAEILDKKRAGETNQLYGIPILLKDNIGTADKMHTSAGSLALADSYALYDADLTAALRRENVVILGKTNMTEYANSMSEGMKAGYSSRGGTVNYPYKKNANPSGSSTGSAVSVTANLCVAAFGTDTAGSIIQPALKNGIVGFRPSIGTFSQKGIIPVSFTLDTAGPMTRTVMDSIIIFSELNKTAINLSDTDMCRFVVGINKTNIEKLTIEEQLSTDAVLKSIEKTGATLKMLELPDVSKEDLEQLQLYEFKYSINRYLSSLHQKYSIRTLKDLIDFNNLDPNKALKYGQSFFLDAEEKTRGDLSEPAYKQMQLDREIIKNNVNEMMKDVDVCVLSQNNLVMQYVGFPIITIPCGKYKDGMPSGICISSISNEELLRNAYKLEQIIGNRVPPKLTAKS